MDNLQLKQDTLNVKRRELGQIFEAAGPEMKMDADTVSDVQQRNAEIEAIAAEVKSLTEIKAISDGNRSALDASAEVKRTIPYASGAADMPQDEKPEVKSLGDHFIDSAAYKDYSDSTHQSPIAEVKVEFKTLLSEAAGFSPQAVRTGQVILSGQQQPRIVDVIPSVTTNQIAVVFMRETTYTNAAAETAEGGTYPEAALAYTEVNMPVRKIAVFLPVTDEQLADVDGMRDRINNRLNLMVRQRLDTQIISGDGVAPNLTGILNTTGILTQAKGVDPNVEAVFKAITKLMTTGFVEPNFLLMHPTDWQNIRLLRSADGLYIFGPPDAQGPQTLWGLTAVRSVFVTLGTAIVGDSNYTEIAYKQGLEFEISNSHNDYFAKGQLAVRAQLRAAFVVLRANALCTVTGL